MCKRLHIKKEDGLTPGKHKIRIKQSILMQYGYDVVNLNGGYRTYSTAMAEQCSAG